MSDTSQKPTLFARAYGLEGPDANDPARQLWELWRQGKDPRVDQFLEQAGIRDPALIVMVLRVDQRERCRLGQWVPAEDYLNAFPVVREHAESAVDLIFAEFLLREERGESPAAEEFLRRFPDRAGELKLQLELHLALDRNRERTADWSGGTSTLHAGSSSPPVERPAAYPEIPGYEVLGVVGRGGMGIVYRAWQSELKRCVAVKMLIAGALAAPEALARFRVEVEAMARLRHPNIVQIYGAGQHAGAPYLVVELVEGRSLAQVLAGTPQPVEWAARTLETLARATHAAHLRGIVHRDLSPANVLMAADGTPKITDFGLAKLIVGGSSMRTNTGDLLGTPSYMAPEQAEGSHQEIGVATDVYALGAMLYEMLTGRPPFKAERPLETLRQVVSDEPVTPSRLRPRLPADLETICLKCLQKAPARRYASAELLADELRRFLDGQPIEARRTGLAERAWLRCKRRPAVAALAAGVVLALLGGIAAVIGVQANANRALAAKNADLRGANAATTKAKNEALLALADTTEAKKATEKALAQSEESRKQAEAVSAFLTEAFRSPDPSHDGRAIKVVDVLDRAAVKLDKDFAGAPAIRGALLDALGQTYAGLGLYDRAEKTHAMARAIRESAIGPDHPDTLKSRTSLARAYLAAGRTKEAIALHEATLKLRESTLGTEHPDTFESRSNLASAYRAAGRIAEAIALHEQTLRHRELTLGPDDPNTLQSRNDLAEAYRAGGRIADALALHEGTLKGSEAKLGADHPDTLRIRSNLASAYLSAGRTAEAITLHHVSLKQHESKFGPDHPNTLSSRNNLAMAYRAADRIPEAIALLEQTLAQKELKLGADHPDTLNSRNNLAVAFRSAGRLDEAIALHEKTLRQRESTRGLDHPDTLNSRDNLATAYFLAGRVAEAITLFEQTLTKWQEKLGPDHPDALSGRNSLANAYEALGQWAKAEGLRRENLGHRRHALKTNSPVLAADLAKLATNLMKQSKWLEAEPLWRECLTIRAELQPDDWSRFITMSELGGAVLRQKKYAEAEPLVVGGYAGVQARATKVPSQSRARLLEAAGRVVELYEKWGRFEKAREWKMKLGLLELPARPFARP
jgi:lipopolysaccharide biosynthesis regulator YciM